MDATTRDPAPLAAPPAGQRQSRRPLPGRRVAGDVPKVRLRFGLNAVCALCEPDLRRETLKSWMRRKWVVPVERGRSGAGNEARFSAWQVIGIAVCAAALREMRLSNSYLGKAGVVGIMRAFATLDDELLLAEQEQSPHTAERVAEMVARAPGVELTPAALVAVGRVVAAIDDRWQKQREVVRRDES